MRTEENLPGPAREMDLVEKIDKKAADLAALAHMLMDAKEALDALPSEEQMAAAAQENPEVLRITFKILEGSATELSVLRTLSVSAPQWMAEDMISAMRVQLKGRVAALEAQAEAELHRGSVQ